MDKKQYEVINELTRIPPRATVRDLRDHTPRTLIYGYTCARDTFHVYLAEDGIHWVLYSAHGLLLQHKHEGQGIALADCVPDKRVYPETCDYDFCTMLKRAGVNIPFTNWNDDRPVKAFHGLCKGELVSKFTAVDFQFERKAFEALVADTLFGTTPFIPAAVVTQLVDLTKSVAESYLLASIPGLHNNDVSRAERWLANLPGSIDFSMERLSEEAQYALSKEQKDLLVSRTRDLVKPRLDELLAR